MTLKEGSLLRAGLLICGCDNPGKLLQMPDAPSDSELRDEQACGNRCCADLLISGCDDSDKRLQGRRSTRLGSECCFVDELAFKADVRCGWIGFRPPGR